VSDTESLFFERDPKKFVELLRIDNPDEGAKSLGGKLHDIALGEILRYGILNDEKMIGPLGELYEKTVLSRLSEERRFTLYQHVKGMVENTDFVSINAFLPFIAKETLRGIVASSVIDYVSLGPLTGNDPMSRPKDIIGLIEGGLLNNEGAAFGGLLHLGDPRVCKLLWPLRGQLDNAAVNIAVKCSTGFLYSASVEFEVDWLEEMDGDVEDGLFGIVASGLALQKRSNQYQDVVTGRRIFPIPKAPTPKEQEHFRDLARLVPLEEYTKRIAPRLYALERTEPPPRVMPHVLVEWGLKPVTDPSEAAAFDDRRPSPRGSSPVVQSSAPEGQIVEVAEEWFDGDGTIFVVWGILNPNGPTLHCLGQRQVEGKTRVFFRWLHMLGGRTYYAQPSESESTTYQEIADGARSIRNYLVQNGLQSLFDTIPSFLISNRDDATINDIACDLISADPAGMKDWGRELAYLRMFGADFFRRAGSEIRSTYEELSRRDDKSEGAATYVKFIEARFGHLPEFKDAVFPQFQTSNITKELYDEWWNIISVPKFKEGAMATLAAMWRGASSTMSPEMSNKLVPFEKVVSFLVRYYFDW
jgi:hypothetical protein